MKVFAKGAKVRWNWGQGTGEGKIAESFDKPVERTIKGATIRRNASPEEPAYLIEQEDGDHVLKSHSELTRAG